MSSTQISLDALPYVDKQIDEPGVRTMVDKLIAQEMKRMPKPKEPSALFPDINLFQGNELVLQELERVRRGKPMPELDLSRYQLAAPTSASSQSSTESTTAESIPSELGGVSEELSEGRKIWQQAVDNANAQLEHQNQRLLNLELVMKFGNNAWNIHNYQLEYDLSQLRKQVDQKKQDVIELNKLRKRDQLEVGESLHRLEAKWAELISSTLQVEVASASMEAELEQLKAYEQNLIKGITAAAGTSSS